MMQLRADEIWTRDSEVAIQVQGRCSYRVTFQEGEAHVLAPGLDRRVEVDWEVYPEEDLEAAAMILIAQLEGGLEL